jgi:hypothetical protein
VTQTICAAGSRPKRQAGKAIEANSDFRWRGGIDDQPADLAGVQGHQFRGDDLDMPVHQKAVRGLSSRKQCCVKLTKSSRSNGSYLLQ